MSNTNSIIQSNIISDSEFSLTNFSLTNLIFDQQILDEVDKALSTYLISFLKYSIFLVIGLVLAFIIKWATRYFFKVIDAFMVKKINSRFNTNISMEGVDKVLSNIVFWFVIVVGSLFFFELLGVHFLSDWLRSLVGHIPNLLIGVALIFIGYHLTKNLTSFTYNGLRKANIPKAQVVSKILSVGLFILILISALNQMGIHTELFGSLLLVTLASLFVSIALVFILGTGHIVKDIISSVYIKKMLRVGDKIKAKDVEGRVELIEATYVVIVTDEGRYVVPASKLRASTIFIDNH